MEPGAGAITRTDGDPRICRVGEPPAEATRPLFCAESPKGRGLQAVIVQASGPGGTTNPAPAESVIVWNSRLTQSNGSDVISCPEADNR